MKTKVLALKKKNLKIKVQKHKKLEESVCWACNRTIKSWHVILIKRRNYSWLKRWCRLLSWLTTRTTVKDSNYQDITKHTSWRPASLCSPFSSGWHGPFSLAYTKTGLLFCRTLPPTTLSLYWLSSWPPLLFICLVFPTSTTPWTSWDIPIITLRSLIVHTLYTSLDCSPFVSLLLAKASTSLPCTASPQYSSPSMLSSPRHV